MGYLDTPAFKKKALRSQKKVLSGIYDQVKDKIIDFDEELVLPIKKGTKPWRQFSAKLKSYVVMASYEFVGFDEDPQFAGAAAKNGNATAFAAPDKSGAATLGDWKDVGLTVMEMTDLDIRKYSAELMVRAYDDSDPLAKEFLDEFGNLARAALNGAIVAVPGLSSTRNIANAALQKVLDEVGAPRQIGNQYTFFHYPVPIYWRRPAALTSWFRYKFVAFVEDDPDDKDKPYKEIYLTLWEFLLMSEEAMTEGKSKTSPGKVAQKKEAKPTKKDAPTGE